MGRKRYRKTSVTDMFGNVIGWECEEKGIKIVECEKGEADAVIVPHHYSHKVTKNSFRSFLVLWHGKIHGAMQLGYGIRPKIKHIGGGCEEVREFDRMWLSDDMPKYSETIVLSLLHLYLRAVYPNIKVLISYADTTVGNKGTIYKAANYELAGRLKADFYELADGERVHPVSMYHRHGTRAWATLQKIYPGIRHVRDGEQLKFIKRL